MWPNSKQCDLIKFWFDFEFFPKNSMFLANSYKFTFLFYISKLFFNFQACGFSTCHCVRVCAYLCSLHMYLCISMPVYDYCRSAWLDFATLTLPPSTKHPPPHLFHSVRITAATTTTTTTWRGENNNARVQHGELHYFCENLLNMPNTQRCMQSGKSSQVRSARGGW